MKSPFVTLVFAAAATVASAQLANSNFETGDFTGWTASSELAFVFSGSDAGLTGIEPLDGEYYAALLSDSSIIQTAGIRLHAGDTVSAWMNGTQNGSGSLDLFADSGLAIHVPWTPVYLPGSNFQAKWNQISFKIQQDGIYSIGASNPSLEEPAFFGVDRFTITPVPESSSFGLLATVSGVAAILWRRRKASEH